MDLKKVVGMVDKSVVWMDYLMVEMSVFLKVEMKVEMKGVSMVGLMAGSTVDKMAE